LEPGKGGCYIDCTLGGGGYLVAIACRIGPQGSLLGLDRDRAAIEHVRGRVNKDGMPRISLVQKDFKYIREAAQDFLGREPEASFQGIVFDLGLASAQLEDADSGISFRKNGPLDMRFDRTNKEESGQTARQVVNKYPEEKLAGIIREYGQERFARRIAGRIAQERKQRTIKTTGELTEIIRRAVPAAYRHSRIHFATRTFQALRIEVNQELESLRAALPAGLELLAPGGRCVVVSYHSLEDKIVKDHFKYESRECVCPPELPECRCGHRPAVRRLTKKVVRPGQAEIAQNPRSRSAKLRAVEKL